MGAPPPPRLAELAAALHAQMPVLFSFAVLRWTFWSTARCTFARCVPARIGEALHRARCLFLTSAILAMVFVVASEPPEISVCAEYAAQRAQGGKVRGRSGDTAARETVRWAAHT